MKQKDIQVTKTQTPVILSKANELEFVGPPGVGKTFAGLAKIMVWLQESSNRTGFFVVSNRYATKYIERLISTAWSNLGRYHYTDKSFNLVNGSSLFLVSVHELNYEGLGGTDFGSFVIDADVSEEQYAFALVKTHKEGFVLKCTLGDEPYLLERTYLQTGNPYLKEI